MENLNLPGVFVVETKRNAPVTNSTIKLGIENLSQKPGSLKR